jgi:hypothetical protein
MLRKTLYGIIITSGLFNSNYSYAANNQNTNICNQPSSDKYEKREEANPIYPISLIIGSLAVSAGAAYYAIRESRKNIKKPQD